MAVIDTTLVIDCCRKAERFLKPSIDASSPDFNFVSHLNFLRTLGPNTPEHDVIIIINAFMQAAGEPCLSPAQWNSSTQRSGC